MKQDSRGDAVKTDDTAERELNSFPVGDSKGSDQSKARRRRADSDPLPDAATGRVRVLLVDEPAISRGLRMLLELEPDIEVVGDTQNAGAVPDLINLHAVTVVVIDIAVLSKRPIEVIAGLRQSSPTLTIVISSLKDDPLNRAEALRMGADAFVCKADGFDVLLATIRSTPASGPFGSLHA
jgi:PleD family two-component response regulator